MKVRMDFVTNSSSSSFVIGTKEELSKDALLNAFKVPKDSPLYEMADDLASLIVRRSKHMTTKELLEYYGEEDVSELPEDIQKIINKGLKVYSGMASNEEYGIEAVFCDMDFTYESDGLIISKEGGF